MAIKLKQVLDGNQGQQNLTTILANATNEIKTDILNKKSEANIYALENYLNGIFYPTGNTQISTEYLLDRTAQMSEEKILEVFNNFNFEDNTNGKIKNQQAINKTTVKALINSVEKNLEIISEKISNLGSFTSEQMLEELRAKSNQLIIQAQKIINSAEMVKMFGKKGFIAGESFQQLKPVINQLKAFSNVLSIPDFVTPQEAGLLFEKALAKVNFVELAEDQIVDEVLDQVLSGAKPIRRGGKNDTGLVSYNINANIKKNQKQQGLTGFTLSQGQMTISYDPFSKKQGKMDVQLNYNASNAKDYRISAKRWSKGYGDLGKTSIDAGIIRAAGLSVAEAYKYAILTPSVDWMPPKKEVPIYLAYEQAHRLAKIAISSDIAMGLNQGMVSSGAGYANLLVIDTGSAIKVKNLADFIYSADEKNILSKYDASKIENNALQIYRKMAIVQEGRSSTYLGLMTSVLNKMKVTINVRNLTN